MPARRLVAVLAAAAAAALALGSGIAPGQPAGSKKVLFAVMTGAKEVGTNGKKGAGDPDGRGAFSAVVRGNRLCYGLSATGIDTPVAAHIHRGGANVAGPVIIPLKQPTNGTVGASGACTTTDASLLRAILANPSRYYVNIHTQKFPGGALRSQVKAG